jgi:hypothetical protein
MLSSVVDTRHGGHVLPGGRVSQCVRTLQQRDGLLHEQPEEYCHGHTTVSAQRSVQSVPWRGQKGGGTPVTVCVCVYGQRAIQSPGLG